MSDTQHTPGPWRYDGFGYIWGPNGEMVADFYHEEGHIARLRGHGAQLPQSANAALIAAAPDLLEALQDVWKVCSH